MLITQEDKVISAAEARIISYDNKDNSIDRSNFREIMKMVRDYASMGENIYSTYHRKEQEISDVVIDALKEQGYSVERKEYLSPKIKYCNEECTYHWVEISW